jgi:site-specific DNA recombinase
MNPFLKLDTSTFMYHDGPLDLRSRAIIYIRVSQAKQDMVSPEQQDRVCRDFAAQNGIEIIGKNVEDIDISGRSFDKRKVSSLIERVRAHEFGTILVWQYSRWARNAGMGLAHINLLEQVGGQLIAVTEPSDTKTPSGILQRGIMLQFAEHYSNVMGETWKLTHARRINAGLPAHGIARFGYKRCPDCRRKEDRPESYHRCEACEGVLVIDPLRGSFLADAYELYVAGKSFTYIAQESWKVGVRSRKERLLSDATMMSILDSGFGAGLLCVDPRPYIDGKPQKHDIEAFRWFPGIHEPVIDSDVWTNFFDRRVTTKRVNPGITYNTHRMSGLWRCAREFPTGETCYGPVKSSHTDGHGESFFRCNTAITFHTCDASRVPESLLEQRIKEWVMIHAKSENLAFGAMQRAAKRKDMQVSVDAYTEAKNLAEERLKRLQEIYLAGDVERDFYIDKRAELDSEIGALENQIKEVGGVMSTERPAPEEFQGLLKIWDRLTPEALNAALKEIISYGMIRGGGGGRGGGVWRPYRTEIFGRWEVPPITRLENNPGSNPELHFVSLPGRFDTPPDQ